MEARTLAEHISIDIVMIVQSRNDVTGSLFAQYDHCSPFLRHYLTKYCPMYNFIYYYAIRQHKSHKYNQNRAIADIRLRPRCAIPHPFAADNRLVRRLNQTSALIVCTPLHGPVQFVIHMDVRLVGHIFSPKIAPSPSGILTPRNTLFLGPSSLIIPNSISI